jgi:beta-1,4-mannosyl-glycoprotein beta-1,4-N-acetylglucosaminyltransferase
MVYDIFFYNNETSLLDIRFNQHCKYVDKFIIITGDKTFSGNLNEINEEKILKEFKYFAEKIIFKKVRLKTAPDTRWENEIKTINFINEISETFDIDDILLISDADEILNLDTLKKLIFYSNITPATLQVSSHYYYLNGRIISGYVNDYGPLILKKIDLKEKVFELRKKKKNLYKINNSGWHFSYIGGINKIRDKIKNFSHSEFDNKKYNDEKNIKNAINTGGDLFMRENGHEHFKGDKRSFRIIYEKLDETYPEYILNNQNKFKDLIHEPSPISDESNFFKNYFLDTEEYISYLNNLLSEEKKKTQYLFDKINLLEDKNK